MKFRPVLLALALLAAMLPLARSVASDASAGVVAEELCFGQVPTIVGVEEEQQVVGTDGPDVVIAHGGEIDTGDGDDLVCVIGKPERGQPPGRLIYAGSGNDRVDNSRSGYDYATYLGAGADEYIGGPAREFVSAFQESQSSGPGGDLDVDAIATAGASDMVFSGGGSDVVDLGEGRDDLFLSARRPTDGSFKGGTDWDSLHLRLVGPDHSWTIDDRGERLLRDGLSVGGWDSFGRFHVSTRGGSITFFGTDQVETLDVRRAKGPLDVRMGAGDDTVQLVSSTVDHRLSGGKGRDTLQYKVRPGNSLRFIHLDLSRGILRDIGESDGEGSVSRAANFENARVANLSGGPSVMGGTSGANVLTTQAYRVTMYGRGGDDVLVGASGQDVLVGGPGYDSADGGRGADGCEAEVRVNCEY